MLMKNVTFVFHFFAFVLKNGSKDSLKMAMENFALQFHCLYLANNTKFIGKPIPNQVCQPKLLSFDALDQTAVGQLFVNRYSLRHWTRPQSVNPLSNYT